MKKMRNEHCKIKIVLTGGHMTPAFAVLGELKKRGISDIIWVGHKFSMLGDKVPSAEYRNVTEKGLPFVNLLTGKLYRTLSWNAIVSFLRIPIGFLQALLILLKYRPNLVMSFGGYLAVPIAFWAWVLRIPVFTHEQTVTVGRANKFIQRFSKLVFLSWKKTFEFLSNTERNSGKFILSGNPLRKEIFEKRTDKFDFNNDKKTIYITGGNQGSHIININVLKILPQLLRKYNVIHQCGSTSIHNDIKKLTNFRRSLGENLKNSYIVKAGFWSGEIGAVFENADILISRSGANIISEILALTKPSILIPIPWAARNEQYLNAKMVEETGLAVILEQKGLNPEALLEAIENVMRIKVSDGILKKSKILLRGNPEKIIANNVIEQQK